MKVSAIIQARLGSTRLPGKVLSDLAGEPMLARVVRRTARAVSISEVIVATTSEKADENIVRLCAERNWSCFRGDEKDVLDRYYRAAVESLSDVVVRITSDCPLIDPSVIDVLVTKFLDLQPDIDYACNFLPKRTFPRGLEVEVMRFDALKKAWREDQNPVWREHVTPYIQRNVDKFRIFGIQNATDYSHMRWTVDTKEDLLFVRCIYDHFGHDYFSQNDVIEFLESRPELMDINRHIKQKTV
ncbi:cytidylyltransferase domain-containing protein [Thermogemmatispora sp.]|uniref:cytidylyltransferase domain-containing protein n=1 Tax=Thermogemmatispora sp. TaxID=1968838 RepID=UPI0035E3FB23